MKHLSVYSKDEDILTAIADIHLRGKWYDLDCTYSKGVFWKNINPPRIKGDILPLEADVMKLDATKLIGIDNNSLNSIVFDPPFLFRKRKSDNHDKMCVRFSFFQTFEDLMKMYKESLNQFYRVLRNGGYLLFKCQDMTDNKFFCTHNEIINYATSIGFELKDIAIKATQKKLQREARQQNCFAKTHSYWLIFKKVDKSNESKSHKANDSQNNL